MSTHRIGIVVIVSSALALTACAKKHGEVLPDTAGRQAAAAGSGSKPGSASVTGESHVGARAMAMLASTVTDIDAAAPVSGTATFQVTSAGVDLTIDSFGCELGKRYAVFIQDGSDCSDATLSGAHWDSPRGEGILPVACTGTTGVGRSYYTRASSDKKRWTIGTPAASDVLDHALVLYDTASMQPLACGTIGASADAVTAPAASDAGAGPSVQIRAQIAGLCLAKMFVRDNTQECPKPADLASCASQHCGLDACVQQCSDYAACLQKQSDPCADSANCTLSEACSTCQGQVLECVEGFCTEQIACAAPVSPDGPCSQLEACCQMQGDGASACLDEVHLIEKYSGDPSCYGVMQDWDSTAHLAVPCKFK